MGVGMTREDWQTLAANARDALSLPVTVITSEATIGAPSVLARYVAAALPEGELIRSLGGGALVAVTPTEPLVVIGPACPGGFTRAHAEQMLARLAVTASDNFQLPALASSDTLAFVVILACSRTDVVSAARP